MQKTEIISVSEKGFAVVNLQAVVNEILADESWVAGSRMGFVLSQVNNVENELVFNSHSPRKVDVKYGFNTVSCEVPWSPSTSTNLCLPSDNRELPAYPPLSDFGAFCKDDCWASTHSDLSDPLNMKDTMSPVASNACPDGWYLCRSVDSVSTSPFQLRFNAK